MTQRDHRQIGAIYRIGQVISSNGSVTISTAYNRNTNDVVGLFIVEIPPAVPPHIVQQALRLLEPRKSIRSQHILHIHDWGIDGSRIYIATDPPRGITLYQLMNTENIDLQRTLDLTRQITSGLKVLHEQGIAGLDLRPHLITVDAIGIEDRAQIDDIGLHALLLKLGYPNSQQINDINALDPRYASPEYINGGQIGPWSDVYQMGLLFFELVTGRPPYVGRTIAETGVMQNTAPIPRMMQFNHDTPPNFQELIERALQKQPQQRFPNADELLEALEKLRSPSRLSSVQVSSPSQPIGSLTTEIPHVPEEMAVRATPAEPQQPNASDTIFPTAVDIYGYLCYIENGKETRRIAITKSNVVVGRLDPKRNISPDIDLSEFDPRMTISRQHARIRFEKTFFYIEDLKSRNKTRLGALVLTPLKAEILQHGDEVSFGSVRMKFMIPGMSQPYIFKDEPQR